MARWSTSTSSSPPARLPPVKRLRDAGIAFTIISARPKSGMLPIADALELDEPMAAFNGGIVFHRDGRVDRHDTIDPEAARACSISPTTRRSIAGCSRTTLVRLHRRRRPRRSRAGRVQPAAGGHSGLHRAARSRRQDHAGQRRARRADRAPREGEGSVRRTRHHREVANLLPRRDRAQRQQGATASARSPAPARSRSNRSPRSATRPTTCRC